MINLYAKAGSAMLWFVLLTSPTLADTRGKPAHRFANVAIAVIIPCNSVDIWEPILRDSWVSDLRFSSQYITVDFVTSNHPVKGDYENKFTENICKITSNDTVILSSSCSEKNCLHACALEFLYSTRRNAVYFLVVDPTVYINMMNLFDFLVACGPSTSTASIWGISAHESQRLGVSAKRQDECGNGIFLVTLASFSEHRQRDVKEIPAQSSSVSMQLQTYFQLPCRSIQSIACNMLQNLPNGAQSSPFQVRTFDVVDGRILHSPFSNKLLKATQSGGKGDSDGYIWHLLITSVEHYAASIQTIPSPAALLAVHEAVQLGLIPIINVSKIAATNRRIPGILKPLCVHNPSRQYELSGMHLPECTLSKGRNPFDLIDEILIIFPHDAKNRPPIYSTLSSQFPKISVRTFKALDPIAHLPAFVGEHVDKEVIAVRETYRLLIYTLLKNNIVSGYGSTYKKAQHDSLHTSSTNLRSTKTGSKFSHPTLFSQTSLTYGMQLYLFFDAHTNLAPNFAARLHSIMSEIRCGGFLTAPRVGGVLLLGATIWRDGVYPEVSHYTSGWRLADADLRSNHGTKCFNFNSAVFGTFAFVMNDPAAHALLTWLNNPEHMQQPLSLAWRFLSDRGIIIRVAYPFLVLPRNETFANETIGLSPYERIKLHRWTF
eukprot:gene9866-2057_t